MRSRWSINDLAWDQLLPQRVGSDLLETVKTAALVEANSADYVRYLHSVFAGDSAFCTAATAWGEEEAQHGAALGRWAQGVDPSFDMAASLARFRAGYRLPLAATASVRGSRAGELVARCVVESGTCSFYSALRDRTDEPVLRQICHHIAQDEARHYRLFQAHLARYLDRERLGWWTRFRIALERVFESADDELAYAYYSANVSGVPYTRATCAKAYTRRALAHYRRQHVLGATHMTLNAIFRQPGRRWVRLMSAAVWHLLQWRLRHLRQLAA
ncbi:MAG: ferritin-like domain-containing protein [Gammaproteobacteria bacterium]